MIDTVYAAYLPNKVVAPRTTKRMLGSYPFWRIVPRAMGRATAYVCEGYACQNPTTDLERLARQLGIS